MKIASSLVFLPLAVFKAHADNSILDVARDAAEGDPAEFSTLVTAIEAAGLEYFFDSFWWCKFCGYFGGCGGGLCEDKTVFAPTDAAFDALDPDILSQLLDEAFQPHLVDVLKHHTVPDTLTSTDITANAPLTVEAYNGESLEVTDAITVDGVNVVEPFDVEASNGVIHAIEEVLAPTWLADDLSIFDIVVNLGADAATLKDALELAALDELLDNPGMYTVFAPTQDAFDAAQPLPDDAEALARILKYHIIPDQIISSSDLRSGHVGTLLGSSVKVEYRIPGSFVLNDGVEFVDTDILATNGIIHTINTVLTPPSGVGDVALAAGLEQLHMALDKAGLLEIMNDDAMQYTVFAPNDEAFIDLLGENGVDDVSGEDLVPILENHVIVHSTDDDEDVPIKYSFLVDNKEDSPFERTTLGGQDVSISVRYWGWWIFVWVKGIFVEGQGGSDPAQIIEPDVVASNGIVHVVDAVILPAEDP